MRETAETAETVETAKRIRRSLVTVLNSAIAEQSASVLKFHALGRIRSHLTPSRNSFDHFFSFSHNLFKSLYLGFQRGVHHVHNPWGVPRGDHGVRPRVQTLGHSRGRPRFYPPRSGAKFFRFLGVPRRPRRRMRGCRLR